MDLSLGITGLSLESALEAHTAQETLGGEDKVFCEGVYCKKNRATRIQILIGEPPRILIAHVKVGS